jgi:pimeloyl-ACP methyl ester carboxylesterase
MHKSFLAAATVAVSAMLFGCGNGDDQASPDAGKAPTADAQADVNSAGDVSVEVPGACTNIVKDTDCDTTQRPFVFVHGTYGSGDNFENIASLLASNGFCADHIVAVEYNSLGDSPGVDCTGPNTPQGCGKIDAAVNAILAKFPQFTQVDLAGHSQGTEHCGNYIGAGGIGAHANKVAHYINFSGVPNVGDVQTLSLSSQHDLADTPHHAQGTSVCAFAEEADGGSEAIGADGGPITASEAGASGADAAAASDATATDAAVEGGDDGGAPACNVIQYTFVHQDHFAVAASKGSFIQVYKYLKGKEPQYTDVQCGDDPVTIEGLSETFADNTPALGKIELRKVTTPRADGAPDLTITPDAAGHFLLTTGVSRNVAYEFAGYDSMNNLIGYQYFTPFKRSNRLLRLLSPASMADGSGVGGPIASMTTSKANRSANSTTVIVRWAGGAFRQDLGATLTVDGNNVLTSDNSGANAFMTSSLGGGVVGLFLEDKNNNGKSDLGLVDSAPFIAFTDVFIDATTPAFVQLSFTPGIEDTDTVNNMAVFSNYPSKPALINVFFQ